MPKADQPTSLRLTREQLSALRREAEKRGWGVSKLVRDVIRQYLDLLRKREAK